MTHPDETDTDKGDPQVVLDKPGDEPATDHRADDDRLPRGQHGPTADYGD